MDITDDTNGHRYIHKRRFLIPVIIFQAVERGLQGMMFRKEVDVPLSDNFKTLLYCIRLAMRLSKVKVRVSGKQSYPWDQSHPWSRIWANKSIQINTDQCCHYFDNAETFQKHGGVSYQSNFPIWSSNKQKTGITDVNRTKTLILYAVCISFF